MNRRRSARSLACIAIVAAAFLAVAPAAAQDWGPFSAPPNHGIERGPGGYLSWYKLGGIVVVYLIWVALADRVNRDALKFGERTGLSANIWNPLVSGLFVAGLLAVLLVPIFIAGMAVFALAALLPPIIYGMMRRGKVPKDARPGELFTEKIERRSGPLTLIASGNSGEQSQSNLIRARQSALYDGTVQLLLQSIQKRTEQILIDYTRDAATAREQIDGMWHPMPTMDRVTGDGILMVLKSLANLDPADRRSMQRGQFSAKIARTKYGFDLQTQGVPTGERVLLKQIVDTSRKFDTAGIGLNPEMAGRLTDALHRPGLIIISSPFGQGLSTTWQTVLSGADRFTRDWVSVLDHDDIETERENIEVARFDSRKGETPTRFLKPLIMKQPGVFVVPNPMNAETMDMLLDQIESEKRLVVTQTRANTSAEALLRVMSLAGDRKLFVKSVTMILCQRLIRCLCDTCKQPVQLNPQAIIQMGGNPAESTVVYRHYQLPPPEARIGPDGQPIEMQPCETCSGIGFVGRTAVFEQVIIDDEIRKVLLTEPKIEPVSRMIRQRGNLRLEEQAWRLVLAGRTSLQEVQRLFQPQAAAPRKTTV